MEEKPYLEKIKSPAVYGVVGGMGPLASSEFIKRIYHYHKFNANEQAAPFIIHYSDPSIPDRTTSFIEGNESVLYKRLVEILSNLEQMGATKFVICCFTIHHLIPQLPVSLKNKIISLVDIVVDCIKQDTKHFLFMSSSGTCKMKILESHPDWDVIKEQVCFLTPNDQKEVHSIIYTHLKMGIGPSAVVNQFRNVIDKYGLKHTIAGCTELHLLTKKDWSRLDQSIVIDPLDIVARQISGIAKVDHLSKKRIKIC